MITRREMNAAIAVKTLMQEPLRNLSTTEPAKLLIFQVGEKGKAFSIGAR